MSSRVSCYPPAACSLDGERVSRDTRRRYCRSVDSPTDSSKQDPGGLFTVSPVTTERSGGGGTTAVLQTWIFSAAAAMLPHKGLAAAAPVRPPAPPPGSPAEGEQMVEWLSCENDDVTFSLHFISAPVHRSTSLVCPTQTSS